MIPKTTLAFSGVLHAKVRGHLFPSDGLEAAAILICTHTPGSRLRLLVREAILVPHAACKRRERDALTWPGEYLEQAIDMAEPVGCAVVLIHSHPGGLFGFSEADDQSDRRVIPSLFHAFGALHGSAVMTADGAVRARLYDPGLQERPVDLVSVSGDDLRYWWEDQATSCGSADRPIAFTSGMAAELGRLSALVIGASGTGSITGEQLARLGFGRVQTVDFDRIEWKNLNRILNSNRADVDANRLKVEVFVEAVDGYRGEGVAIAVPASITTREAVLAAAECDVIFCCVDTLEARHIADLIAAAFLLPLFDVGVVIPVRKKGDTFAVADVCGRIDYVQPGGSTLQDRGIYTPESLRGEYLRRVAPEAHQQELEAGYLKGLVEEAPAVITLNMRAASACVNEFIARAYPFRLEPNHLYARTEFSLAACEEEHIAETAFTRTPNLLLARGNAEPLLGMPMLRGLAQ
ncbi:ThiF family adenylyltransferase [Acidithiobacillus ferriphilus]|uniref:ThiF family adenylyltransferase n=1 Tax=Acidithiobacillus ferriphilus TaxID=1689834 RepID=UPI002DB93CB5|nr:ThiF family adenylyltransferase [Acidithiobacillus ferriphilus]MEB8536881.1 ThiF family adenylyltransferase [Acidithiobacillus ferriphilus]